MVGLMSPPAGKSAKDAEQSDSEPLLKAEVVRGPLLPDHHRPRYMGLSDQLTLTFR